MSNIAKQWNDMSDKEKLVMIRHFPEEAKSDDDWYIRREAYYALGFTEEAKSDYDWNIRQDAKLYFSLIEESKDKFVTDEDGKKYKLVEVDNE